MFINLEKSIINKNFINIENENKNKNKIWCFAHKDDFLKQINLEFNEGKYLFSFPIHNIHYSTSFKNKTELQKYIQLILNQYNF
tara:strand:- start:182 stop:433 length:252 start_codon:yes stop_codon:yes gene_type:complete